jgi:hypothetical protein
LELEAGFAVRLRRGRGRRGTGLQVQKKLRGGEDAVHAKLLAEIARGAASCLAPFDGFSPWVRLRLTFCGGRSVFLPVP